MMFVSSFFVVKKLLGEVGEFRDDVCVVDPFPRHGNAIRVASECVHHVGPVIECVEPDHGESRAFLVHRKKHLAKKGVGSLDEPWFLRKCAVRKAGVSIDGRVEYCPAV